MPSKVMNIKSFVLEKCFTGSTTVTRTIHLRTTLIINWYSKKASKFVDFCVFLQNDTHAITRASAVFSYISQHLQCLNDIRISTSFLHFVFLWKCVLVIYNFHIYIFVAYTFQMLLKKLFGEKSPVGLQLSHGDQIDIHSFLSAKQNICFGCSCRANPHLLQSTELKVHIFFSIS